MSEGGASCSISNVRVYSTIMQHQQRLRAAPRRGVHTGEGNVGEEAERGYGPSASEVAAGAQRILSLLKATTAVLE